MITIVHGSDSAKSRNYYIEEKQKIENPIVIPAKSITFDYLFQTLEGNQLFSQTKNIFIENFFSEIESTTTEFKKIIEYINKKKDLDIFFWDEKELSKSQLFAIKNSKPVIFNYPQVLFSFLDGIAPGNKRMIELLSELKQNVELEIIFYMITRQFRFLLALSEGGNLQIDEVKRLAPWQVSKFKKQLGFFSREKLLRAYKNIYDIDYKSKFGLLPYPLGTAIDIFLLDL